MGKEKQDISQLSASSIIREAFGLFSTHLNPFLWIQLTLGLPSMTLRVIFIVYLLLQIQALNRSHPSGDLAVGEQSQLFFLLNDSSSFAIRVAKYSAVVFAYFIVNIMAMAVWKSSTLYAVGMIHKGISVSFVDVMHSMPRLWWRVMVNNLYVLLFFSAAVLLPPGVFLLTFFFGSLALALLWMFIIPVGTIVVAAYFGPVSQLFDCVSVEEGSYGWAALKKSSQLMEGRKLFAEKVLHLLSIPSIPFLIYLLLVYFQVRDVTVRDLPLAVIFVVSQSFMLELTSICRGLLYFSFSAYHGENMAELGTGCNAYIPIESSTSDSIENGFLPVDSYKMKSQYDSIV